MKKLNVAASLALGLLAAAPLSATATEHYESGETFGYEPIGFTDSTNNRLAGILAREAYFRDVELPQQIREGLFSEISSRSLRACDEAAANRGMIVVTKKSTVSIEQVQLTDAGELSDIRSFPLTAASTEIFRLDPREILPTDQNPSASVLWYARPSEDGVSTEYFAQARIHVRTQCEFDVEHSNDVPEPVSPVVDPCADQVGIRGMLCRFRKPRPLPIHSGIFDRGVDSVEVSE